MSLKTSVFYTTQFVTCFTKQWLTRHSITTIRQAQSSLVTKLVGPGISAGSFREGGTSTVVPVSTYSSAHLTRSAARSPSLTPTSGGLPSSTTRDRKSTVRRRKLLLAVNGKVRTKRRRRPVSDVESRHPPIRLPLVTSPVPLRPQDIYCFPQSREEDEERRLFNLKR